MFDFELRERADQDAASTNYHALYHDSPIARYWDDDFVEFVGGLVAEGDRILDLGCGPGSLWSHLQELPTPSRLVGVDISEGMIREARRRHPDGEFEVARAHELPFADGSFDVVIASSVLHHIPDSHVEGALAEIVRVLDEHGRLVGREPTDNRFAGRPGWFSGSLMAFRHLVFRLTRSREYPEPELGEHHHVFEVDRFVELLRPVIRVTVVERRFPFSSLVLRVDDERVARLARFLDTRLSHRDGPMFYFAAERNYTTVDDVANAVRLAREEDGSISDAEFLAYVEAAAREIERALGNGGSGPTPSPRPRRAEEAHRGS
jgi:SAM-dependent methyltransferase